MQNSFGSVVLNGTELTVFDEDVLLAIISTKNKLLVEIITLIQALEKYQILLEQLGEVQNLMLMEI